MIYERKRDTSFQHPILGTLSSRAHRRRLFGANSAVGNEARKGFPLEQRLRRLGLRFQNRRHHRGDLTAAYKLFSGGLDLDPSLFFLFRQCGQA